MIENYELTELQYAETGDGPWRLYVYDRDGYYTEKPWFRRGPMQYPDEEITIFAATEKVAEAMAKKLEVRITDGGDMLVFHANGGKVLYGEEFWMEVGR